MDRKVAIVTGASGCIGKSICEKLAKLNMDIIINYNNDLESAENIKTICEDLGVKALIYKGDISKKDNAENLIKFTIDNFQKIDVLVNNAGIAKDNLTLRMSDEDFREVIDVNLLSTFYMMKFASKFMIKKRQGSIINISSIVGIRGNIGQINYAASKAGIIGMTKTLAKELGRKNIRVNSVAPGFIKTKMTDKLSDEIKDDILRNIPLNKLGECEDIANIVGFLAMDESRYITGQVISVDGGMNI